VVNAPEPHSATIAASKKAGLIMLKPSRHCNPTNGTRNLSNIRRHAAEDAKGTAPIEPHVWRNWSMKTIKPMSFNT